MEVRTVRSLHGEAMALALDADFMVLTERSYLAAPLLRKAAALEWQAVAIVRDLPNNQPTLGILETSAQSLEQQAYELEHAVTAPDQQEVKEP